MRYGYIRVSRKNQRLDRQIMGLRGKCDKFIKETVSAATVKKRPKFSNLLKKMKSGDVLVIWDLDRAFRSAEDAIVQERLLRERGITIEVVIRPIDTSTALGNKEYQNRAVDAEYERRNISERTKEGLEAAKLKGKRLGRKPAMTDDELSSAKRMIDNGEAQIKDIANQYGIEPWSVTRAIRRLETVC